MTQAIIFNKVKILPEMHRSAFVEEERGKLTSFIVTSEKKKD